jgi:hypothetical protein
VVSQRALCLRSPRIGCERGAVSGHRRCPRRWSASGPTSREPHSSGLLYIR